MCVCAGGDQQFGGGRGGDWNNRGPPGRDGDSGVRQNDRWQEPEKRPNYGGRWQERGPGGPGASLANGTEDVLSVYFIDLTYSMPRVEYGILAASSSGAG